MKQLLFTITTVLTVYFFNSCEPLAPVDEAYVLEFSTDTLRFDTVFTSAGSVTQTLKLFNRSPRTVRLTSIALGGGATSSFRLNTNGTPGSSTGPIDIPGKDSIYLFVSVNINPTSSASPFLIADSIRVQHGQITRYAQLRAYGQNAVYLRGQRIRTNTTWTSALPYVIENGLLVEENATLTLQPGTRVYVNAASPLFIDGTLIAEGTKTDSITFQGDRLDKDYRALPGSWPGIYFRNASSNNRLRFVYLRHAYQGIVAGKNSGNAPKLTIDQCVIENCFETGIAATGSSIRMNNTLVSNCGINILFTAGGQYELNHCTIASFSSLYLPHKKPVLYLANWDSTTQLNSYPLQALIRNTICWGDEGAVDDEIVLSRRGSASWSTAITHSLYRAKNTLTNATLTLNLLNQPPLFDSIDTRIPIYDFRITKGRSPAINKGTPSGLTLDLDNRPRDGQPDIGCFEKQ
jgi:hypothetical protein